MFLGQKDGSLGQMMRRALATAVIVVGQWCQFKNLSLKDRASIGHVFMAWGFFIFAIFYFVFIIIGAGFGISSTLENTSFFFYYAWVMDIAAPFVIIGALWGIIRRYIVKPPRLEGEQTIEAMVILGTVLIHPMTHLLKEATSIALAHPPAGLGSSLPPISSALSNLFSSSPVSSVQTANIGFFWTHWSIVLFVLVFIAYSRYLHIVASVFNIFLRSSLPKGALRPLSLETAETFGASKIEDFTWKQLLDLYSCVVCGQCQDSCPAYLSGKPLSPKKVIQDLREHLLERAPALLKRKAETDNPEDNGRTMVGEVMGEDEIWNCTTCYACQEVCPVYVEPMVKLIEMRRNLVMEQASIPETGEGALKCLEARGHPWRGTTMSRTDWAEGFEVKALADGGDIDVLFWVGCTEALEERSTRVAQAIARILQIAGVNFGILGTEELCCGDPARRLGNEYLFQIQAQQNIAILNNYGIKRIVTGCPHCYNTLKHEYPQFGGAFEVVHHTELIAGLIKEGRLQSIKEMNGVVTYHDSCYLGRYNAIFDAPRQILHRLNGVKLVEMERNLEYGFCCGAGGGHLWLEEQKTGERINEMRTEQALSTQAEVIATTCPYCLQMFEDGIQTKGAGESVKIMDIAELVMKAIS
jgi:Fe-S oxidoreductase